jgi:DNA-binding transcriptional regulator YdaS (Cro superfamily)
MDLKQWLEAERGRATAMADHFGVNKTAVFGWKVNGVPPDRMKAVRDFSAGAITLEEMVPDSAPAKVAA